MTPMSALVIVGVATAILYAIASNILRIRDERRARQLVNRPVSEKRMARLHVVDRDLR